MCFKDRRRIEERNSWHRKRNKTEFEKATTKRQFLRKEHEQAFKPCMHLSKRNLDFIFLISTTRQSRRKHLCTGHERTWTRVFLTCSLMRRMVSIFDSWGWSKKLAWNAARVFCSVCTSTRLRPCKLKEIHQRGWWGLCAQSRMKGERSSKGKTPKSREPTQRGELKKIKSLHFLYYHDFSTICPSSSCPPTYSLSWEIEWFPWPRR